MTVKQPVIQAVYALVGEESFSRRQAVERIVNRATREDPGFLGATRVEGTTAELADVLDELQTLALLGGRRVVIVDSADPFISQYRKQLEAYCGKPSQTGCLVLLCKSLPRNTRMYRIVAERGEIIDCSPLKPRQIIPWIVQRGRDGYGKAVDAAAAGRLRELVGGDLAALDNELAKLAVYVGQREQVTGADVNALVGQHREEIVFRVTDAMSEGDAEAALKAWEQVLATDRAAPARAVAGLAWGVRRLLEAKEAVGRGESLEALAGRSGPPPAVLNRRLQGVSAEALKTQLCELCEADLKTKTGRGDIGSVIETFIVRHTRPRGRAGVRAGGR